MQSTYSINGNAVTSWENTASRPRSHFNSMLILWLLVHVK